MAEAITNEQIVQKLTEMEQLAHQRHEELLAKLQVLTREADRKRDPYGTLVDELNRDS